MRDLVRTALASSFLLSAGPLPAAALSLSAGSTAIHQSGLELSGITWAGGNQYYAVEDQTGTLYPLTISVTASGGISCSVGTAVTLSGASDLEGCAWDPAAGTVWVSMESSSTPIREYDPASGAQLRTAPVPQIFISQRRGNYSLEALTISGDGLTMWTCNEESLTCDGDRSTTSSGCYVRLARFTRSTVRGNWVANGQWAYKTDPLRSDTSLSSTPRSGVSGLCALPDGTLLVLEREFSGSSIRIRIYTVDFANADNIETLASFDPSVYNTVTKSSSPLYTFTGSFSLLSSDLTNYEGLCLGPRTGNGTAAIVMIADGGSSGQPYVRHLKLSGLDVSTVTYTGPEGCEPVGGPYRYVTGSTVATSLPGAGDPYETQLRTHAAWTGPGSSSGDGSSASYTVSGDGTFAWSSSTDPSRTLLATDSFERIPTGSEAGDIAGWSGDGWVAEEDYAVSDPPGYPLPLETHARVLAIDGAVERTYASSLGNGTRLEAMVRVTCETANAAVADAEGQVALVFDAQGRPTLQHASADGSRRLRTTLSNHAYADGEWVRVEFAFDYESGAAGTGWCRVSLDGQACSSAAGVASPANPAPNGPWHRAIGSGASRISSVAFEGFGAVDDMALHDGGASETPVPATVFWVGCTRGRASSMFRTK